MVLGDWTATCKRMKLRTLPNSIHKDKLKMDYRPKCKTRNYKTSKLLQENIGRTLNDINQSRVLFDSPPRVMEIKTRINKWDLIKLKAFAHKENYKQGEKTTQRMGEK